ncbi:ASPARTATE-GLUTAMATE RACEMASE FAMILY [Salix viminalis]|uniref:ASPARTATE-GLUTAMATE RACEMASE FAMILY n=1 Tax=Salix viminalis TaxID=40686 RepID=A0A9Q0YYV1_SALVM|nr:ASPARTATE-GLUTAMATE RACEMASE FAMILY [Salix viminalis]
MFDRSLAMPFHTMNPFHILGHVNTDESGKFPNSKKGSGLTGRDSSDSLLSQANAVGIIGGISVISASNFLKKLVQGSSQEGNDCIPFVLCSNPILNKELLSHERNSFPSLSRQNESFPLDHSAVVENLRSKRLFLEKSGARCIVMPCHISHSWHDEVSKGCSVPFLHMGKCVAMELKEAKLKPLEAGSPLRIGLLATNATLTAGFYQEKLQSEGFEVVLPDKATMEHAVIPAIEAVNRKDMEGAQNLLRIALQVLLVRALNTIILASDDMHNVLPQDDPLLKKCIDPMDALARSAIKWVQTAGKGT